MFSTLSFIGKWKQRYRVLRYRKGFGLVDSVRYGLRLGQQLTGRCCLDAHKLVRVGGRCKVSGESMESIRGNAGSAGKFVR